MGSAASSGVSAAIEAATTEELKAVLPPSGAQYEKLSSTLAELNALSGRPDLDDAAYEGRLRGIFDACDIDGSGDMDLEELIFALERDENMADEYGMAHMVDLDSKDDIALLFKAGDTDNDGCLSWKEFHDLMVKLHDGQLDEIIGSIAFAHRPSQTSRTTTALLSDVGPTARANIHEWRIDYWELDKVDKSTLILQAIKEWGCLLELSVPTNILRNFIGAIQSRYLDLPYHSFLHALATVHYVFRLVEAAGLTKDLSHLDRFVLLISALCHDAGHRGRNSHFEVITLSDIALRYNDRSVLENHHSAIAFEVALGEGSDSNIFKSLENQAFLHIRKRMVRAILGTDMSLHHAQLKHVQAITGPEEFIECEHGEFAVEIFMHMADIGNPFMPVDISTRWGKKVAEEFNAQVEDETRLGLPITSMMAGLLDPKKNAMSRVGFIDFVVAPLAKPLIALFPGLVQHAQKHLDENREAENKIAHDP